MNKKLFYKAVNAILSGQSDQLKMLIKKSPDLVNQRALENHQATLLHYLAANGIEDEKQKSPANGPQLAEILLAAGADPDAKMEAYGGSSTTLDLLVSSYHPFAAGTQANIAATLIRYGAAINGVDNNTSPIGLALAFGYRNTAETLMTLGARVDNLVYAAGLGLMDIVESYYNEDNSLKPEAFKFPQSEREEVGRFSWPLPKKAEPGKAAMIFSGLHGRNEVIRFLLERGVSANASVSFGQTALHFASITGYADTVRLLLKYGADPKIKDSQMNGNAVDWAIEGNEQQIAALLQQYF